MITGFNTDVKYAGTVYHVQTEDKGLKNPLIESLIYVKGAILDSYRSRYEDFTESGAFKESLLQKILESQHRQIVTSIKKGKYRKGMTLEAFVEGNFIFEFQKTLQTTSLKEECLPSPLPFADIGRLHPKPIESMPAGNSELGELSKPQVVRHPPAPLKSFEQNLELSGSFHSSGTFVDSIDASVLDKGQGIEICVESSKEFMGGTQVDLQLHVQSRQSRMRIENVQIIIKVIGTAFSPRLYAGKTDRFGSLRMNFSLPVFSGGSAALIIQASTAIGSDEIKYLIKKR